MVSKLLSCRSGNAAHPRKVRKFLQLHYSGGRRRLALALAVCAWLAFLAHSPHSPAAWAGDVEGDFAVAGASTVEGVFHSLSGDPPPGAGGEPKEAHMLFRQGQEAIRLNIDQDTLQSLGGARKLQRKRVAVTGGSAARAGSMDVQSISPAPSVQLKSTDAALSSADASSQSVIGSRPWISILCKFSDIPTEPKPLSYFQNFYGSSSPLFNHYWPELSYDAADVTGSGAVGWFTLPRAKSYYVYDMDGDGYVDLNFTRATNDCVAAASGSVSLINYIGINLMFNSELDGFAWGGTQYLLVNGQYRLFSMTWEPPWGYSNQCVLAHEMGHGFGLPHSSGSYGYTYDNCWDVMSDTWSACSFNYDPVYGCVAQHTIAYHKDLLGWVPAAEKYVALSGVHSLALERIALPTCGNYKMVQVPIAGSATRFYTIEARETVGYDYGLPGQAVIIHQVDTYRDRPAYVVDQDGNGDPCDGGSMWTTGEVFHDYQNDIAIRINMETATGYVVTVYQSASSISTSTAGVFRPSNGQIYLKKENTTGVADAALVYGIAGDIPVAGDWDGDGVDGIGVYRNGEFYLKNSTQTGYADMVFAFGQDGDKPVAGDWNGDGVDTIGVYRDGVFLLRNSNNSGQPEMTFTLGMPGDVPIAGNWDGSGGDSCGVFRPINGLIYLKNQNTTGYADVEIVFGIPGDSPVTGDWDGDSVDTIGVYREGVFLLRNSNETGYAEMMFWLGQDGDAPIAGRWGLP